MARKTPSPARTSSIRPLHGSSTASSICSCCCPSRPWRSPAWSRSLHSARSRYFVITLWGGIENVRATHHVAATVLMLVVIFHLLEIGYKAFVLRTPFTMLPGFQDVKDAWMALRYNLGLGKSRPQMGRYSFEEKAEYWALVWGILIMALTGFAMWNPLATVRLLPGDFIPAAKTAHGAEAILAVLAIIVWHMYGVHVKRFNKAMWTGQLTEEEMLHEHPLELADIKAGLARRSLTRPRSCRSAG